MWKNPNHIQLPKEAVMPVVREPKDYLYLYFKEMWNNHRLRFILGLVATLLAFMLVVLRGIEWTWVVPWAVGAWVSPSTRTSGDLITAVIWNQDVVDNVQYLYDEFAYVDQDNTDRSQSGAGTTAIVDITVPGGLLGANDTLVVIAQWWGVTGAWSGNSHDIALYYGSTQLGISTGLANVIFDAEEGIIIITLSNLGATNSQRGSFVILSSYGSSYDGGGGTAAEDSTGDLDLEMRFTVDTDGEIHARGTVLLVKGGE